MLKIRATLKVIHPEFPDYFVRADGCVERRVDSKRGPRAGDIIKGRVLKDSGYRQFKMVDKSGKQRAIRANRLICEAFHGAPPTPTHHAAHENGRRLDNREENLYWATPVENRADSIRHGTLAIGARVGTAVLSDEKVLEIREKNDGKRGTLTRLALEYGVGRTTMRRVLSRDTWKRVGDISVTKPL